MKESFVNEMKRKLEEERAELRKRLGSFAKEDKKVKNDFHSEFPQYGDKEEDNATEVAEYQDNLSVEGNLENRLQEIEKALEKVSKGEYGICTRCNHEISEERLKVNPAAATCVKCKKL